MRRMHGLLIKSAAILLLCRASPTPAAFASSSQPTAVTLVYLVSQVSESQARRAGLPAHRGWSLAVFRTGHGPGAPSGWAVISLALSDSSGKQWGVSALRTHLVGRELHLFFRLDEHGDEGQPLWLPGRGPVSFCCRVARSSGFAPDQVRAIDDVPMPRPGKRLNVNRTVDLRGARLTVLEITGKGGLLNSELPVGDEGPRIRALAPPDGSVHVELIRATDNQGRAFRGTQVGADPERGELVFSLPNAVHRASRLRLCFGFEKPILVQALLRPVPAEAKSWKPVTGP